MDDAREPQPSGTSGETSPATAHVEQPVLSPAAQKWLEENSEAIEAFNGWYERNGSPLDEYRTF